MYFSYQFLPLNQPPTPTPVVRDRERERAREREGERKRERGGEKGSKRERESIEGWSVLMITGDNGLCINDILKLLFYPANHLSVILAK